MKWYKHDANAHGDAKLERVMIKYGMEGYGLYWYCLELISQTVEPHNLNFELEHDAEIISHRTGIHYERVQEMMAFMVDLGLFEQGNGTITCFKLAKRCDEYTSKLIRNLPVVPTNSGHTPDKVPPIRIDKNRIDKNIIEHNKGHSVTSRFEEWWKIYPKKVKKADAKKKWKLKKLDAKADTLIADVANRIANDSQWADGYIPHPTTYLNGERWEDEISVDSTKKLSYAENLAKDMRDKGML
jgi:hypothetical protein